MSIPGVGGDRKREAVGQRLGRAEPAPGKSPDGGFVWIILNAFRKARQTARKKKKLHRNKVSSHETMMDRKPPLKGGLKGLAEFSFTAKQSAKRQKKKQKTRTHTFPSWKEALFHCRKREGTRTGRCVQIIFTSTTRGGIRRSVEPSSASHYDAITVEFVPGGGISRSALTNHSNKLKRKRSNNAVDSFCSKVLTNCCVLGTPCARECILVFGPYPHAVSPRRCFSRLKAVFFSVFVVVCSFLLQKESGTHVRFGR